MQMLIEAFGSARPLVILLMDQFYATAAGSNAELTASIRYPRYVVIDVISRFTQLHSIITVRAFTLF